MRYKVKTALKRMIPKFLHKGCRNILNRLETKYKEKTLYFQVHLTYHCNLKCKSCSHFSAISENKFLDIKKFENDFKQLSSLGQKKVRQIDILGGEPLLHQQINDFLSIARKYFRKAEIVLLTNGILLSKMSEIFWKTCSENKIIIYISYYPISLDLHDIKYKAKKYNVILEYNSNEANRIFGHFRMDINGNQDVNENVKLCYESKNCHCLDNGRMFLCYIPACIDIFNKFFNKNIPVHKDDYIDIYKAKSISEIIEYLKRPMPFCKYCNVKNRDGTAWGISKKDIKEWT
jgi:organic radical activating enzyme